MSNDIRELDNILFRFAMSDNGDAFNQFLDTYMVNVISKLNNATDEALKKKVLEVLGNINKRTMFSPPGLVYPLDSLLELYHKPTSNALVKNFSIVYVEKAFNVLASEKRLSYLTNIVTNISQLPKQHQDIFCHIILNILLTVNYNNNSMKLENDKLYPWRHSEKDCKILLLFFLDLLLVPGGPLLGEEGAVNIPPCHSAQTLQSIMGKNYDKYDFTELNKRKMSVLQFLANGVFSDTDVLIHFIVASCDPYQEVNKKADDQLKRLPKINWENELLIDKLYSLFQGQQPPPPNTATAHAPGSPPPPATSYRLPGSSQLREKIFHFFCKSILAANKFPQTLQVIFEGVYGTNSTFKVKQAAMSFVQWVFRHAQDRYIESMGSIILGGLLKLIDSMESDKSKDANELKAFTYTSLGMLCKRNKTLFNTDLTLVMKLMSRIGKEEPIVTSAIQDCLVMLREAFLGNPIDSPMSENLLRILMTFIYSNEYLIRYIVLQWAQHCFDFPVVQSRYFSLVMVGDTRPDIREEARRGLEPYNHNGNMLVPSDTPNEDPYPNFQHLLQYIVEQRKEIMDGKQKIGQQGINLVLGYSPVSFEYILTMLRKSLRKTALEAKLKEQDYLAQLPAEMVSEYLELIECAMNSKAGDDLVLVATVSLLHLLNLKQNDSTFAGRIALKLDQMNNHWLKNGKHQVRDLVSKIIALVSGSIEKSQLDTLLNQYIDTIMQCKLDFMSMYAPLSCIAHIYAYLSREHLLESVLTTPTKTRITNELMPKISGELISHTNQTIRVLAIQSVGLFGLYNSLPTKDLQSRDQLLKSLMTMLDSSSTERNILEAIIVSLGWVCLGDRDVQFTNDNRLAVIDSLFKQVNNKNEELQFTIGDSLSLIVGGDLMEYTVFPFSPFTFEEIKSDIAFEKQYINSGKMDVDSNEDNNNNNNNNNNSSKSNEELIVLLKRILNTYFSDRQSPITRCSAGIWMLCLLKNFGRLPSIQPLLTEIQNGFCSLLADNNELTQDVASKGITLVYDSSVDPKFKEFLVSNLSKTLSGKPAQKAPGSSEMLPEGSVNAAKGSGSVTTYKELSNLSTDLGKPDMIYKFMNLSNHHQVWNSRKGASFAIVSLASKAREEMAPLIPHLVPKIYRYLYDPSPKIAQSMKSIMNAIIDPKDIFPKYFTPIMNELLSGMGTTAWRVREASCAAIPDTISHASIEEIEPYIEQLYYMNFRTLDDIKETVRKAAEISIKSLGTMTCRLVESKSGSSNGTNSKASSLLGVVIPLLLQKGITNDSNEVKQASIQQLLKICNSAKEQLKPFVPELVHVLLESLSTLEPTAFNYASFHAESLNITQEQIERARIEVSKMSPVNDILDLCLKYIDETNTNQLIGNILQMLQFSVGVVTRVGVAKFIASLFQSRVVQIEIGEAHIQKLITSLFPSIMDKSPATRRQFISTLCLCIKKSNNRIIKQSIAQIMEIAQRSNSGSDLDENTSLEIVGLFFKELYRIASSEIQGFNKDLIPFLYFMRSHPKKEVSDIYTLIWEDNSIGSIKLYTDEIIKLINTNLTGSNWGMKQQAALCLSNLTEDIRNMIDDHLSTILGLLLQGMKGKTYPGKDSLLQSMSTITNVCSEKIKSLSPSTNNNNSMIVDNQGTNITTPTPTGMDLLLAMVQECKKIDLMYKRKAIVNLSSMIKSLGDLDIYEKIKDIIYPILFDKLLEKEQADGEEGAKTKPMQLLVKTACYEILGAAYAAASKTTQRNNIDICDKLLDHLVHCIWNEQESILSSLSLFIKSIYGTNDLQLSTILSSEWIDKLYSKSFEVLSTSKYLGVKNGVLDLFDTLISVCKDTNTYPFISNHFPKMKQEMEQAAFKDTQLQIKVERLLSKLK